MTLIPVQWRQRQADCWVLGLWGKFRMAKVTQRNLISKKKKRETLWYFSCIYVICVPLHVCHVYLPLCIQFMSLSCMCVSLYACYMFSFKYVIRVSPCMHVTSVPLHVCVPLHLCPLHAYHVCPLHVCRVCLPLCMLHVFSFRYVMCPPSCMSPFMYIMCVPLYVCYECPPSCICIPLYVCHVCPLAVSSGLLSLCRFCFCFLSQGLSMTFWLSWSLLCRSDWPWNLPASVSQALD